MRKSWLALLLLSGCMVGPNYQMPEIAMPSAFTEADGAENISDEELCSWWKQFGDPQLDVYIAEAAQGNYDYRIALEQVMAARAEYQIQSSYLYPEIDLNATPLRQRFSQNIFSNPASATTFASGKGAAATALEIGKSTQPVNNFFQIGFDAVWELDVWGKYRRSKQAAYEEWEKSEFLANGVLISVIAEVARDYVAIRGLQHQVDLYKKKIKADERELELTNVLFAAGLDDEIAVQNQVAALDTDKAQLCLVETSLKQMIYAFAVLLGKQPEVLASAFEEISPIPIFVGKVPAGLPSELLRRRPDVRASERELAAATEQIGIAISALYPSVALTGDGIGYMSNQINTLFKSPSRYWTIGPLFNWDVIDWGRTRGQIDLTKAEQREALYSYENTVLNALEDVEGALVAYFEEESRNKDLAEQVAADARSFTLTEDLFQAGLASEIQDLESLKTLIDAEVQLVQSQQSLGSDLISLYKAMGGDWECSSTL